MSDSPSERADSAAKELGSAIDDYRAVAAESWWKQKLTTSWSVSFDAASIPTLAGTAWMTTSPTLTVLSAIPAFLRVSIQPVARVVETPPEFAHYLLGVGDELGGDGDAS